LTYAKRFGIRKDMTTHTVDSVVSEVTHTCDGPVTPYVVISRIMVLSADNTIPLAVLSEACYNALTELGCDLSEKHSFRSTEY